MSAPALILLSTGDRRSDVAPVVRDVVAHTRRQRPDLTIEAAFLAHARPDLTTLVSRLHAKGHAEIVVVPLTLSNASDAFADLDSLVSDAAAATPGVQVRSASPVGAEAALLNAVDRQLRAALHDNRVRELDGLVLVAEGSSDAQANAAVARLARTWGRHHHLPTAVAYACTAPPSTGEAIREFRRQGRRHVAVARFFVTNGQLAEYSAELAHEAGAVAVSDPIGAGDDLSRIILARYSVGAFDLVDIPA